MRPKRALPSLAPALWALLATVVAGVLERLPGDTAFPYFVLIVAIATLTLLYNSPRAGIVATVVCALGVAYFFLPPYHTFRVAPQYLLRFGLFVTLALLLIRLISSVQMQNRLLQDTVSALAEPIIVLDRRDRVILLNEAAEVALGISNRDACRLPAEKVFNAARVKGLAESVHVIHRV